MIHIGKPRVGRSAPNKTHAQSVLFDRDLWDESRARRWLNEHDYRIDGLDRAANFLRFRQYDPDKTRFEYRTSFRQGGPKGVSVVWGIPRGRVRKSIGRGFWDGLL